MILNCNNLMQVIQNAKLGKIQSDINFEVKPIFDNSGFIVYSKSQKISPKVWFNNKKKMELQSKKDTKNSPTFSDLININEDYALRLYYYLKFNRNSNNHLTVVMINPAFACSETDDSTINKIRKNLQIYQKQIGSFSIINISPIRNPYPDCLNKLEQKNFYDKESYYQLIDEELKKSNDVLLAWGNNIDKINTDTRMKLRKILPDKVKILGKTSSNNPMHPCARRKLNWNFQEVELDEQLRVINN